MDRGKINNIIRIPASLHGKFFRIWVEFLSPFHNLTAGAKEVATAFIKQRYDLSKVITDEALLDKITMGRETKQKIKEELGMTTQHLQVIMGKLKKAKIIVNGKLNPKFLPKKLSDNDDSFQLLLYFDLNEGDNKQSI